jgi:glycosyltransferase involved in cell wall biosynthesis
MLSQLTSYLPKMFDSSTPLVSVVIAVRNRADLLQEALHSVCNQTISNWECIIVDDNSTEDIATIITGFNDPRFIYKTNTHTPGVSGARNTGNQAARAPWIAVADSDDINLPRRLELSLRYAHEHPGLSILYSNLYNFIDGTLDITLWRHGAAYDRDILYERNFIGHNTVMYRKELALENPYNENLESAEDYDLWLRLADKHIDFGFIAEPLALYRRHADQFNGQKEGREKILANARLVRESHQSSL